MPHIGVVSYRLVDDSPVAAKEPTLPAERFWLLSLLRLSWCSEGSLLPNKSPLDGLWLPACGARGTCLAIAVVGRRVNHAPSFALAFNGPLRASGVVGAAGWSMSHASRRRIYFPT